MPLAARRLTPLALTLTCALVTPAPASAAEAKPKVERLRGFDLELDLWEVSGVETAAEAYENQLSVVLEPSYDLGGRLLRGTWLEPLQLSGKLALTNELSGNDSTFRGSHFASPTLFGDLPGTSVSTEAATGGASAPSGQITGAGRRIDVGDLTLSLTHDKLFEIPRTGIRLVGGLRVVLPTSVQSRNAGLYFAPSLSAGAARHFGPVELTLSARAVKYFFAWTDAHIGHDNAPVYVNGAAADVYQPDSTGNPNPNFAFVYSIDADVKLPHELSASIDYSLYDVFTFTPSDCAVAAVPTANLCTDGPAVGGVQRPGRHDNGWFMAELDWKVRPWTTVGLGLSTYQPARLPDGDIANPFWRVTRDNLTTVYLSLSATAEALAQTFGKNP